MKTLRMALFLLLLGTTFKGFAKEVTITCRGADAYAGMELYFLTWQDMITYKTDTLLKVRVRDDGSFEGTFDIDSPRKVLVYPGVYEAWFYAEPGKAYRIVLPSRKDKTMKDILNPYFRPEKIQMGLLGTDKNDLNRMIAKFKEIYAPYFYRHARMVYVDKKDTALASFIRSVRDTFAGVTNPFFVEYMNARLAMISVMNLREREPVLDEYRDFGRKVLLHNPAYMELFNQIFNRYFDYLLGHPYRQKLIYAVDAGNYDSLVHVIKKDLALDYDDFVDMVALKGIYDAWYHKTFDRKKLLILLDNFIVEISNPEIRQTGEDIKEKFTRLQAGSMAPGFFLTDLSGKKVNLADFKGKFVYLNFSSRLSYSSLREFPLLKRLKNKYANILQIITVAIEDQPSMLKEFVSNKDYDWTFLVCGNACNLSVIYNVRAYPTYYLIGRDGKLIISPAPPPTEDFERRFRLLLQKKGIRTGAGLPAGIRQ